MDEKNDGTRSIKDFSVHIVDGLCKVLIMLSIPVFLRELQIPIADVQGDAVLSKTLASFQLVRCSFKHYANAAFHHLEALRSLGFMHSHMDTGPLRIGLCDSREGGAIAHQYVG